MNKASRLIKRYIALLLVLLFSIESFAAVVGDNDGAAFITKAEFDSLKNDFQSQLDRYNSSIDNKIDGAIAAYLAGIKVESEVEIESTLYKIWNSNPDLNWQFIKYPDRVNGAGIIVNGGLSLFAAREASRWRATVINKSYTTFDSSSVSSPCIWYYQKKDEKLYLIGWASDSIRSSLVLSGSTLMPSNGTATLTFGDGYEYSGEAGSSYIPTYTSFTLGRSVNDLLSQNYLRTSVDGWSQQNVYYTLSKQFLGGTLTDYRNVQPAGAINKTIYASDFDLRGTSNWEYWKSFAVTQELTYGGSTCTMRVILDDAIPVFKFKATSFNINSIYNYLANTVGEEMPYYGGLPLCKATLSGTCSFAIKVDKACYLTIKDNEYCQNKVAYQDPGVEITKNSETTSANYIELAANTTTKLTFPSTKAHAYYIKLTPRSTTDVVKIVSLDNQMINKGE